MFDADDVTYLPLNISISEEEIAGIKTELYDHPPTFQSVYRTCEMIPIYTPKGSVDPDSIRANGHLNLDWTAEAARFPVLREFLQTKFLSFLNIAPKIVALRSSPYGEIYPHIDCSEKKYSTRQHKLRICLSGDLNGLYFLSEKREKVFVSGSSRVYVIDGSHPHGAINQSKEKKITICLGAPWEGRDHREYEELLVESYDLFREKTILRSHIGRPYIPELFQEKMEGDLRRGLSDWRSSI